MSEPDTTTRFTDRVADYVRYRPDYPPALVDWLQHELGATPAWQVADVAAGTGISSRLFLDAGFRVIAVEPNAAMRDAAFAWLGGNPRFRIVHGRAEATGLDDGSVGLVTVAQAFHWFDPKSARREFQRILRPHGIVAIWWNSRHLAGSPFLAGYEALLRHFGTDYASVAERYADDARMRRWFGRGLRGSAHFDHRQHLDFDGLRGRLMSSSYAPKAGHRNHAPMLRALRGLFDATAVDGHVDIDYDTRVFAGEVA